MPSTSLTTPRRLSGPRRGRGGQHGRPRLAVSVELAATMSARRAGGPQDSALYQCSCGSSFTAGVSTSVGCPTCGQTQAW